MREGLAGLLDQRRTALGIRSQAALRELLAGRGRARAALAASLRIGALTVLTCAWWIAGLVLQGAEGLPVLQFTETVRTVSSASSPGDILRGLGNWFFYGYDRTGYSLVQAQS